ncbi:MCE family protein [Mycolicibacterium flavescens]|uniref:MCE-family protein MCE3A n=1 Tax=Mycolicibacterium flavescens TaxID=1776 RepID=A0A1E3RDK6_MYCFV|nr:MCE family protein [Mycolicibacterium flavescens]MCV7282441.1 MCE family protein [Mycolicibacterium flavescens]ODQ87955.1 MCE-family protein MCE3A [Mycolicibacterium flavescens]
MAKKLRAGDNRIHPAWWTLMLAVAAVLAVLVDWLLFTGNYKSYVPVTVKSERTGLIMETGNDVKLRGITVGRVDGVAPDGTASSLNIQIDSDQVKFIPSNVQAEIKATTAFGNKFVDLIVPDDPSPKRLAKGDVLVARNVATEINTVFENLVDVLQQVDTAKLNAVLSALADGLRGQGESFGEAITAGNEVLRQLNPRAETIREDWRALKDFSDTYSVAADDIVTVLDAVSTTSETITKHEKELDSLLLNVVGLANSGIDLLAPSKDNLVRTVNALQSTTSLLMKYNPQLTCTFVGGKNVIDFGFADVAGGATGKSVILDVALLLGDDQYKYPQHLPIIGAKGGPGGKPGCGSLPDVAQNWPQRHLVTDTGWGGGLDVRPNPGIGFPGYENFFPYTRANGQPPTVNRIGPPAPGPIPYPGAPPYGARQYAPDGTPLYPGLPPAPPPGAPKDDGPRPGVEPFVPPHPAEMQPVPQADPPPR